METKYHTSTELLDAVEAYASKFEKNYHGCAQCVLAALMEIFPRIQNPEAFKSATGLAGGVGLTVEGSCGGLTGGVMGIGLFYGRELQAIEDPEGLRFTSYRLAARLHERFVEEYGTSICGKIHKQVLGRTYRLNHSEEWDRFIEAGGHSEKCPLVVGKAARWAAEVILAEEAEQDRKFK